jgi:hypothetical protein
MSTCCAPGRPSSNSVSHDDVTEMSLPLIRDLSLSSVSDLIRVKLAKGGAKRTFKRSERGSLSRETFPLFAARKYFQVTKKKVKKTKSQPRD